MTANTKLIQAIADALIGEYDEEATEWLEDGGRANIERIVAERRTAIEQGRLVERLEDVLVLRALLHEEHWVTVLGGPDIETLIREFVDEDWRARGVETETRMGEVFAQPPTPLMVHRPHRHEVADLELAPTGDCERRRLDPADADYVARASTERDRGGAGQRQVVHLVGLAARDRGFVEPDVLGVGSGAAEPRREKCRTVAATVARNDSVPSHPSRNPSPHRTVEGC